MKALGTPDEVRWRCKGALTNYGINSGINYATDMCDLQVWDASLNDGEGGWVIVADGEDRPFIIEFVDNGTGKGKNAGVDEFGFDIDFAPVNGTFADPSLGRTGIKNGNIDVKDSGWQQHYAWHRRNRPDVSQGLRQEEVC